ncbi:hypothetical protein D3C85_849910 [compost metagenome]
MGLGAVRIALCTIFSIILVALPACGDGYPRADALSDRRMSVSAHLRVLNRYLEEGSKEQELSIKDDCHLILSRRQTASRERILLPLFSTGVVIDTDQGTGDFRVQLMGEGDVESRPTLRLIVKKWVDAVAWRSHFQQLQMRCVAWQETKQQ